MHCIPQAGQGRFPPPVIWPAVLLRLQFFHRNFFHRNHRRRFKGGPGSGCGGVWAPGCVLQTPAWSPGVDPPPSASHPSHLPPSTPTLAASPPPPPAPPPQSPPTTLSPPRLTHAATQTESDLVPAGSPGGDFAAAAAATETPGRVWVPLACRCSACFLLLVLSPYLGMPSWK